MLRTLLTGLIFLGTVASLYFPNAAVLTRRDVGRQLSLNITGNLLVYASYDYQSATDDSYAQRVRIVSNGLSLTLSNLSSRIDSFGFLSPMNFSAPITIINDNTASSLNATDFALYFVQNTNATLPFPVYSLVNGSITVWSDSMTHGVTILNAKPSVISSSFQLKTIPYIRIASCGFDSAANEDFAMMDVSSLRQSLTFFILNGPIATFYDPKPTNSSFSFTLNEATSLDRSIPSGAEFVMTSAGYATVNASYNVDPGMTLKQNFDFGKDTMTQIVIDGSDFRDGEKVRFIASGSKKSVDVSLNATNTIYEPDVYASTLAVTVTVNDTFHYPRFKIKVVSDAPSNSVLFYLLAFILIAFI